MASAAPRSELECSVCLNIYTDPVTLRCGHNFCQVCIDRVLDTQERYGGYFCPVCRKRFKTRPVLQRKITLHNMAQEISEISSCTYCVDSPAPAMKCCLHCDAYLCDKHLRAHNTAPHHVLCDPTTPLQIRKCSAHNQTLKYSCSNDGSCICATCSLDRGHEVKSLDEDSEKETLRNTLQKHLTTREETEERVQKVQEHRRKVEDKAADDTERVTALFTELRRFLWDLEKRAVSEISGQEEPISMSMLEMIWDLEIKTDELSTKMCHVVKLCNMTDPLTVLQGSDTGDLCDTEDGDDEDRERHDRLLHDGHDLDVDGILHTGLSGIITGINVYSCIQESADILLDVSTARNDLHISDDRRIVSISDRNQTFLETPKRFQNWPQVLSSQSFSSGRHYWEVAVRESEKWIVGVCYPSIERRGDHSLLGNNNKSWCLLKSGDRYVVMYDRKGTPLSAKISSNRVRIFVDYEAGRISFYDVCDPIRHLHTFTTTFTEPIHAGFYVGRGCIKICRENQEM